MPPMKYVFYSIASLVNALNTGFHVWLYLADGKQRLPCVAVSGRCDTEPEMAGKHVMEWSNQKFPMVTSYIWWRPAKACNGMK